MDSEIGTQPYTEWVYDPSTDPISLIKHTCNTLRLQQYSEELQQYPPEFCQIETSLRSPFTSQALVNLPREVAAFRAPSELFSLVLKRKLRIPLYTNLQQCPCGQTIDLYGDHFYRCTKLHKTRLHHRLRDTVALITSHLAPTAGLTNSASEVILEPTGTLPQFPSLRPADVCIHLSPSCGLNTSHLFVDVTHNALPSRWTDPNPPPVAIQHEKAENRKFHCQNAAVAQALVDHHYTLLPFTFDSLGNIGPIFTSFLLGNKHHKPPYLITSQPRCATGLSSPASQALAQRAITTLPHSGLFSLANHHWAENNPHYGFTTYYSAQLPSQWASQVLGQNLILALGDHLYSAMNQQALHTHPQHTLASAASRPRYRRPRPCLSPIYYFKPVTE
jgi:hypothetical protein